MTLLTAAALEARALEGIAHLVASCAAFQTLVGEVTETAALDHVYWPATEDPDDNGNGDPRPKAVVEPGQSFDYNDEGLQSWCDGGSCLLSFEFVPSAQYLDDPETDFPAEGDTEAELIAKTLVRSEKRRNRLMEFMNLYAAILIQMGTNSNKDRPDDSGLTYPRVRYFRKLFGPGESLPRNERGVLFLGVQFEVGW